VSDITVADGLQVHAGETLNKVWSIKNVGEEPWPAGTRLVFVGGSLMPESDNRADEYGAVVPFAAPGDVVHISIDIIVPSESGRFRGTFRLQSPDGQRFGPRCWVDVHVPEQEQQQEEEKEKEKEVPVTITSKPNEQEPESVKAEQRAEVKEEEEARAAAAPAPAPVLEVAPASGSSAPAVSDAKAEQDAAPAPHSRFPYTNELAILRSMGFRDVECCRYLLLNNAGDVSKVVTWLLSNAGSQ
jgi:hypothetical protein